MALTTEMFEPFKSESVNIDIVNENKFGVFVAIDGSWEKRLIQESDFNNYELFGIDFEETQNDEKTALIQKIDDIKNSNEFASWVYVSEIPS